MADDGGQEERFLWKPPSGPKACLAVVGCGTLAALVMVGLVVGALRLFASSVSADPEEEGITSPTRGPVTSLEPGSFDLCESAQNIQSFDSFVAARVDENENFVDTAEDGGSQPDELRLITNHCVWDVKMAAEGVDSLVLSYESVAGVPVGDSASEIADEKYEQRKSELVGEFDNVHDEGSMEGVSGETYFLYGETRSDGSQVVRYVFIAKVKSSYYEIMLTDNGSSEFVEGEMLPDFRGLVREVAPEFRERLDRVIPD